MILIDQRVGSNHLVNMIPGSQLELLEYGDAAFTSIDNRLIGVEIKTISDAISSMLSGRLADHQIPGLLNMYDVIYLIVEGYYRSDPKTGVIQWRRGKDWEDAYSGQSRVLWSSLDGWLTSMEMLCGIHLRRTVSAQETALTIQSLYHWWQKEDHKSLRVFNTSQEAASTERPGLARRVAAQLPMIGWQRSSDVANKFKSVRTMVNASIKDWIEIDGIGKTIAMKIQLALDKER